MARTQTKSRSVESRELESREAEFEYKEPSLLDIPEGIDFSDFDLDFYRELVRVLFDQPYTCGNYRAYYARKGTDLNRTSIRSLTQISIRKTLKHLAPNRIDGKRICC